jgi:arylsulfatase A-like enzyme
MTGKNGNDFCLLITADTFRYDHFGGDFCSALGNLQQEGVTFENCFSTGSGTSSAFPGILASSYPLDYGYRGLNDDHTPVAEWLSSQGVQTVGVTSSSHASSLFNYDRGFDEFHEDVSYREDAVNSPPTAEVIYHRLKQLAMKTPVTRRLGSAALELFRKTGQGTFQYPYQRAEVVTDNAISAISQAATDGDTPVFAWVHYMEPHSPYYPPDDILDDYYSGRYSKADVNKLLTKWYENRDPLWTDTDQRYTLNEEEIAALESFYKAQIAYLDREVGRLFDWLQDHSLFEDSLIMFTSDHGDEFFDHGDFGHRQKLYDELIHVPFVLRDGSHQGSIDTVASHIDIGPTICEWFGVEAAADWRGSSLLPVVAGPQEQLEREYVFSELSHRSIDDGYGGDVKPEEMILAVMTNEWKLIYNNQNDSTELYRLGEAETPTNYRFDAEPEVAEELVAVARQREDSITARTADRQDLSEEVRTRLHELGYVGE